MKLHLPSLLILPFIALLSACETTPANNLMTAENYPRLVLPIATTVQIDYQDEVKLLRLNQLISEHKGSDKEKAMLYYERGLIYDRMGLGAHSRYDFTQSINTEPSFAEAYNSLGVYLLFGHSYDEAFDAFDAAIELNDKIQYSYLHRAFGLYHVKRYSLASDDINHFYELDTSDPFRVLWRYIIDSKINAKQALLDLQSAKVSSDHYAWLFVDVIAGRISEQELLTVIGKNIKTNKEIAERLCEAYFYLGHWHQLAGHLDKAIYYFKLTSTTGIHEFIEYKYALMQLGAIQKELSEISN